MRSPFRFPIVPLHHNEAKLIGYGIKNLWICDADFIDLRDNIFLEGLVSSPGPEITTPFAPSSINDGCTSIP